MARSRSSPDRRSSPTPTLTAGPATLLAPNTGVALPSSHGRRHLHRRQHCSPRPPTSRPPSTGATARRPAPASSSPPLPPASFDVEGGHIYAKPGVFTTTSTSSMTAARLVVVPGSATVTDLAVTGKTGNFTAIEGINTGQFVLATYTDPNTLATVANENARARRRRLGRRHAGASRASRSWSSRSASRRSRRDQSGRTDLRGPRQPQLQGGDACWHARYLERYRHNPGRRDHHVNQPSGRRGHRPRRPPDQHQRHGDHGNRGHHARPHRPARNLY